MAIPAALPAEVQAAPASLKVSTFCAPASRMDRLSRSNATPVSFPAATLTAARLSPRISSLAATVLPAFMQLPAT